MADYKTQLHEEITRIHQMTKQGKMPREVRMWFINALTEEYFANTGEWPDTTTLERMADLCLYEELTDPNIHKVAHNEYPFLSEHQFDRRDSRESAVGDALDNSASDGRKHLKPTRRVRTDYENNFVDKKAKIRNQERKKSYHEFTKVQPVITRKIGL